MRLAHITLTTGHTRWSALDGINAGLLAQLGPIVTQCERIGSVELPSPTGLMLLSRLTPPSPSRHVACWAISEMQGPALVTMAVAMRPRQGAGLWCTLHELLAGSMPPLATSADSQPPAPWLAVALHLPALLPAPHPALHWLGDAERCIAWAWIEHVWRRNVI